MNTELIDLAERIYKYTDYLTPNGRIIIGQILLGIPTSNEQTRALFGPMAQLQLLEKVMSSVKWAAYPKSTYGEAYHTSRALDRFGDFESAQRNARNEH